MAKQSPMARHLKEHDDYNWTEDLHSKLADIIRDGRASNERKGDLATKPNWGRLGQIVAAYLDERRDWAGYLNKTQTTAITKLTKRARKMLEDLSDLKGAGAEWYLQFELEDAGLGPCERKLLIKGLKVTSEIETRSPRLEPTGENDINSLNRTVTRLHDELQVALDQWWTENTGLPKNVSNDFAAAYGSFLKELLGRIKFHNPPGASRTAVQAARKAARARDQSHRQLQERFAEALRKLSQP